MLYPQLDDPLFNVKISNKKEFSDSSYDGTIYDVDMRASELCDNPIFEISPHQAFIRNYLSNQTPYNGMLLFHGVGSGKTCSAITISEEYREYMKQMGIKKKILVIANSNVTENYKLQLFNQNNLKEENGQWNISGCIGNKFLKEINPMEMKGLQKDQVINNIKKIISQYYEFVAYREFGNYLKKNFFDEVKHLEKKKKIKHLNYLLKEEFDQRLIIIDEVHQIRTSDEGDDDTSSKVSHLLINMLKFANTKLLLLSATPMFHSYEEIINLINMLNQNDKRPLISVNDVFNSNGEFKENGKEILINKSRGYISFVRGENPYTFPYRIFPSMFIDDIHSNLKHVNIKYDIVGKPITNTIKHLDVYMVKLKGEQLHVYNDYVKKFKNAVGLNYSDYGPPIQLLNMVYPSSDYTYGDNGLRSVMNYVDKKYEYKKDSPRIFDPDILPQYSAKISKICEHIMNSTGIVLVYSQYIGGGIKPLCLALESIGITKFDTPILRTDKKITPLDSLTMTPDAKTKNPAKYIVISGEGSEVNTPRYESMVAVTSSDNSYGKNVKVVIVSKTGSEGIDLKNIRQIHIMDPWYNMNRIEQIIGRGIRNCSHKSLPFIERNAEIYLYTSYTDNGIETVDQYLYRLSEENAVRLGKIYRLLKETSVDCILNIEQQNFTEDKINQLIKQKLSSGNIIDYYIGDKPYTFNCDYMSSCQYQCVPSNNEIKENEDTYSSYYLKLNNSRLVHSIQELFKKRYVYTGCEILAELNLIHKYSDVQIYSSLSEMIEMKIPVYDIMKRKGTIINIDEYFIYQPKELINKYIPMSHRIQPIPNNINKLRLEIPEPIKKEQLLDVEKLVDQLSTSFKQTTQEVSDLFHLFNIQKVHIKELTIDSLMERLNFNNMKSLIEYIVSLDQLSDFETHIYQYIKRNLKKNRLIVLKDNQPYLLTLENNTWISQRESDLLDMQHELNKLVIDENSIHDLIGFIANKALKADMVFKTLTLKTNSRNTGETCHESQRKTAKYKLDKLLGYTMESIEQKHNIKIHTTEICMLLEFILRFYDKINYFDKRCFFTPSEYITFIKHK